YEESLVEGEIYISLHMAIEQAEHYTTTADLEILRLAVHGTLHLLGYEDETPEKKKLMSAMEDTQLQMFREPMVITGLPADD
ncbi:MAG: rRNA maturation RNase YbeY, partial [Calditrichota bacterium]